VQAFSPGTAFDVSTLEDHATTLRPLSTSGWDFRHNFDGFLTYSRKQPENAIYTYVQVFRNGCLEAVDALLLRDREGKKYIPSVSFEEKLAKAFKAYLAFQRSLGVEPPVYVGLSLLRVFGYYMGVDFRYKQAGDHCH
jgi:hypothetical protein